MSARRILVVDDERSLCDYLAILLRREGYQPDVCISVDDALEKLSRTQYDLVLSDLMIGSRTGLEVVRALQNGGPPIVLMTAYGTVEKAVEALRNGASDFILKPFQNETLIAALRGALEQSRSSSSASIPPTAPNSSGNSASTNAGADRLALDLVGSSQCVQDLRELIRRVAPSESTVLITGESGTGKEVVARSLHRLSHRAARPFLPIHCAALSEGLLESELFGHVKGSFTGASQDSIGLFVAAKGGTVFLDEIGEIPLSTQVKLLRVLQEREVTPVGGHQSTTIDVRIVAATNANLEAMVRKGTFREDLFYRLNVIRLDTPPLRNRREDIAQLGHTLLEKIARRQNCQAMRLSEAAVHRLASHDWPGNIRELENTLERSMVLCQGTVLEEVNIALGSSQTPEPFNFQPGPALEEIQRAYIFWVLVQNQWNVPNSAAVLGLDPSRLQRMIEHYGFQK